MKSAAAVTVIDLVLALYVCIFLTKPTALKQPMLSSTAQVAVRATPGVTIDMVKVVRPRVRVKTGRSVFVSRPSYKFARHRPRWKRRVWS